MEHGNTEVITSMEGAADTNTPLLPPPLPAPTPPPIHLTDLPHNVLHSILQKVGLRSRLVCRHLHKVSGPLTGGLRLPTLDPSDLDTLLSSPRFHHITQLDLTSLFNDSPLATVATHYPHLQTLSFKHCMFLSGPFQRLAPLAPTLQTLTLNSCRIQQPGFHHITQLTSLKSLSIPSYWWLFYPENLIHLKAMQQLESLCLSAEAKLNAAAIATLAEMTNLRTLSIQDAQIMGLEACSELPRLSSLSLLSSITLRNVECGYHLWISALAPLPSLAQISIEQSVQCPPFTHVDLPITSRLSLLHSVKIKEKYFSDSMMHFLSLLPCLKVLFLNACVAMGAADVISSVGVGHLGRLADSLEELRLAHFATMPTNTASEVTKLTRLRRLALIATYVPKLQTALSSLTDLEELTLAGQYHLHGIDLASMEPTPALKALRVVPLVPDWSALLQSTDIAHGELIKLNGLQGPEMILTWEEGVDQEVAVHAFQPAAFQRSA